MSRISHITPRYIVDRLALMAYERRHPNAPWLTAAMIDVLDQWLRPADRGLEWGSGRSTVWLASRVSHLVSVEDNSDWGKKVRAMLVEHGLQDRVSYNLIPIGATEQSSASPYVSIASTIAPASLDFCLVDGSLREHCALAAIPLLRPGGLMIIDNIERYLPQDNRTRSPNSHAHKESFASVDWVRFQLAVADWRSIWTTNGIFDTALWVKSVSAS